MTGIQKTIVGGIVVAAIGTAVYQGKELASANAEVQRLRQEQSPLRAQITQLSNEQKEATAELEAARRELQQLRGQVAEIHKMRADTARMRQVSNSAGEANATAAAWKQNIMTLIQKLKERPEWQIPELQFVTDKDWANASWEADVTTEDGVREALSKLREEAQNIFKNKLRAAIEKYAGEHGGMLPDDITELQNYFDPPVKDAVAMLKRYELLQKGKLSEDRSKPLARNIVYADEIYDSNHEMSLNGAGGGRFNRNREAVDRAMEHFSRDNPGQVANDPVDLQKYLDRVIDPVTVGKYMRERGLNR